MSAHTPTGARSFRGERPRSFSVEVTNSTPQLIVLKEEGDRTIVNLRFVNTQPLPTEPEPYPSEETDIPVRPPIFIRPIPKPDGISIPQLWLVPRNESVADKYRLLPEGLEIYPGRGYVEPGTLDSPIVCIGYGEQLWVAAEQGSFNLWVTLGRDWK